MEVCTIIAKNYLAHARVLARSLTEHNPGARLWTVIIDDFSHHVDPAAEPFEVLTPEDIGCEPFRHMAMRYTVLELSTAVKPWLLRHLLARTGKPVTYLDPDIKVFGSLQVLDDAAAEHGVVLTPHNAVPIPDDGRRPSQVDVMIAGVYNLGYVSIGSRPEVDSLLDWWSDRLLRDCRVDPIWGYFVDQRWFDLVPGLLSDLAIVREPEYNVAYWNLHSRRLTYERDHYLVDGRPLAFFHYSGFDPADPRVLSRHQNRIDVADHPALELILAEYAQDLHQVGHAVSRDWPYSYNALADGTPLDDAVRALFDEYATERDEDVASPFTLEGAREFEAWFSTQAPDAPPGINRVLACVYEQRPDLRSSFPDPWVDGGARLREWAAESGTREVALLARAMAGAPAQRNGDGSQRARPGRRWRPETIRRPYGVNVLADFGSTFEPNEIARQLVSALDEAAIPAAAVQVPSTRPGRERLDFPGVLSGGAPYSLNLLVLEPEGMPELGPRLGAGSLLSRHTVALCPWTSTDLSAELSETISLVDEIWAPSEHVAGLLAPLVPVAVHRVAVPVSPRTITSADRGRAQASEEDFLFISCVDYREGAARVNPRSVVEAFRTEFNASEPVRLVLVCSNSDLDRQAHGRLLQTVDGCPQIEILSDPLPGLRDGLLAGADAYVSLHRETAFGVTMAAAAAAGTPVIATGYSGNLEFMRAGAGLLVDYDLVEVPEDVPHYPADAVWANPDLEHAGALMRRVVADRDATAHLGQQGAAAIADSHGRGVSIQTLRRRLDALRVAAAEPPGREDGGPRSAAGPRPPAVGDLSLRLRQGPVGRPNAAGGAARDSLRKAVLRAMQPYTAYQDGVNEAMLNAIEAVCDVLDTARDEVNAERPLHLAHVRRHAELLAHVRRHGELAAIVRAHEMADPRLSEIGSGIDHVKRLLTLQTDRSLYLALTELNGRHSQVQADPGPNPDTLALTPFELRVFSQNGEDGVLAEILRRIGAPSRYFVEFGVESGREGNSVYLADVAGWSGLYMEADESFHGELAKKYAAQPQVTTLQAMVKPDNVEDLFAKAGVPEQPDVLSIDIDGSDYWVWEAISAYRPRVVIVEYNSSIDPRRRLVQPKTVSGWDETAYYGASLASMRTLGEDKGYRLVHTELSGVNAFFVREDLARERFPTGAEVAQRGIPNYFQRGYHHPAADPARRYLDLDSGDLVSVADAHG